MYAVSEKFKNALKSPNRKSRIAGTLTTSKQVEYQINDSNIIKNSLYVTNQIVNNNKLCFGSVYAAECGFIINSDIDRYSLFGATVKLDFILKLEDSTEESLPLGVFTVDTAERVGSRIKITAIDNMSKFDIDVSEDINDSLYELLKYISNKCEVELAQSKEEIEALHINATSQAYTIQRSKINTYRDALAYLCMIICANATIDNMGRLKLVQYTNTSADSNDRSTRLNNCNFSDYETTFKGVKARFFANENYYTYDAIEEDANGLILDFGDIPIVGGTAKTKNDTIDAILQTVKQISYVPATLYIASNPTYELGDMITCRDINNTDNAVNTYVMAYKYSYREKETINCYGENPLLQNIKTKNDRQLDSIENQINTKDLIIVNATNVKAITIKQDLKNIVNLKYSALADCRPICLFTVPFTINLDGYVEFSLYDGLIDLETTYKGYYEAGEHFATFVYLDDLKENQRRNLIVNVKCYADINSVVRVQGAQIKALRRGVGDIFPIQKTLWESGSINSSTGQNIESTTRIRSDFIRVESGQNYKCIADNSHSITLRVYNANKEYRSSIITSFTEADFNFKTDTTDKYIRFVLKNKDDSAITADEVDNVFWNCEAVETLEIDTTEPTITIKEQGIKAIVYTQGLDGGKGNWDGTLEFTESFNDIAIFENIEVETFNINLNASTQIPIPISIAEAFGDIAINDVVSVENFTENIDFSYIINSYYFDSTNGEYSKFIKIDNNVYMFKTEYKYISSEQAINNGKMYSIVMDEGLNIESVDVLNEECSYLFDVRSGTYSSDFVTAYNAYKLKDLYEYTSVPITLSDNSKISSIAVSEINIESMVVRND